MSKKTASVETASKTGGERPVRQVVGAARNDGVSLASEVVASAAATPPRGVAASRSEGCSCHRKDTPRDAKLQADLQKRLNRAIGQLNGIKAMIEDNRYCGDVLIQLAAAESAVHSVSAIMLQNHLETCVVEQIECGNVDIIDEAMQLIKKFAR